jgi:excisionase family DNA binding protein
MDRELRHGWIAASRPSINLPSTRKKMIMTVQAREKLMSLTDVSEMLGIPVQTLYRWRYKGDGPAGYRVGRHVRYRREAVEAGWSNEPTSAPRAPRMTPGSPYRPPPEVEAFSGLERWRDCVTVGGWMAQLR